MTPLMTGMRSALHGKHTAYHLVTQLLCTKRQGGCYKTETPSTGGTIRSAQSWLAILTERAVVIGLNDYSLILHSGHFYMLTAQWNTNDC